MIPFLTCFTRGERAAAHQLQISQVAMRAMRGGEGQEVSCPQVGGGGRSSEGVQWAGSVQRWPQPAGSTPMRDPHSFDVHWRPYFVLMRVATGYVCGMRVREPHILPDHVIDKGLHLNTRTRPPLSYGKAPLY